MTVLSRNRRLVAVVFSTLAVALGLLVAMPPSSVRAVYLSPSGNYKLVVHGYYRLLALPGDSTGAPGYVELFDRSGKKLGRAKVPLVLDVSSPEDVRWYERAVTVPGVFDFALPSP